MEQPKWTCVLCGKEFSAPNWECPDGRRHKVAEKEYYSRWASLITYPIEEKAITMPDGGKRMTPAKSAQFHQGIYRTSDPEEQMFFDAYPGRISKEQWEEIYISKEERLASKERALAAREAALSNQENELLKKVKANVGK